MVAVGDVVGGCDRRFMVWFDPSGLPVQASLDIFDRRTSQVTATVVIPCEPFDSLPEIYGAVCAAHGQQLELPL